MTILKPKTLFGVMAVMPTRGFPPGKLRLRMRAKEFVRARVKTPDGIREFYVKEEDGHWVPTIEIARNSRQL